MVLLEHLYFPNVLPVIDISFLKFKNWGASSIAVFQGSIKISLAFGFSIIKLYDLKIQTS